MGVDALGSGLTPDAMKCGISGSIHGFIHVAKHALFPSSSVGAIAH